MSVQPTEAQKLIMVWGGGSS